MGDEQAEAGDDLLTPDERASLTEQLARLNANIERQFEVIEQQRQAERAADRRANQRRWAIVMVVVLLIVGGNVRFEWVRREQRQRDNRQDVAAALASCQRTNGARTEIRGAFDDLTETMALAFEGDPEAQRVVLEAGVEQAAKLAERLPPLACEDGDTYASCAEAQAAGATPLHEGDPGYSSDLDADGDGLACE